MFSCPGQGLFLAPPPPAVPPLRESKQAVAEAADAGVPARGLGAYKMADAAKM